MLFRSEDFLFINDDHLILQPTRLEEIPAFHKGDMNSFPDSCWQLNFWRKRLQRTRDILNEKGMTAFHFDCHTPILFNKGIFPLVMQEFPFKEGIGLTMKSLYGNSVYAECGKRLANEKKTVFQNFTLQQLNDRLAQCTYMSFNDQGLNDALKEWLYRKFPVRSKWETTEMEDKIIEIIDWLESSRDFSAGVAVFKKYVHGVNLLRLFENGETPSLRKKLEFKMESALPRS